MPKGGKMNARRSRSVEFAVLTLVTVMIAAFAVPHSAAAADAAWLGEYYPNPWLMGPPAQIREDGNINFNWGGGSPASQIPADNFSVRWTRTLTFDAGRYRFTTETDDGVRLFLDGALVIEQWRNQPPTAHSAERELGAGQHSLRMEYFEATGGASARLSWARVDSPPPQGAWRGEYYANRWMSAPPAMVRDDGEVQFDWGDGSPAPSQIPPDNFSVRWTRSLGFDAGRYRFTTTTDDGVRLYLDGQLIIDQWRDQTATSHSADRDLGAGQHSLRMEYYEGSGGAVARLSWKRIDGQPPQGTWRGEYFANPSLSGSPVMVRDDGAINFDWGEASPAPPQVPPDNFSVRWTRSVAFDAGRYRFTTTTDDGVRLYLDGQLIIDQWRVQAAATYSVERNVGAGQHSLRMEYFEAAGRAVARLSWARTDAPPPQGPWRGEYFANRSLSGSPTLVRILRHQLNWGSGHPPRRSRLTTFGAMHARPTSGRSYRFRRPRSTACGSGWMGSW
jgi:hypothetical protein